MYPTQIEADFHDDGVELREINTNIQSSTHITSGMKARWGGGGGVEGTPLGLCARGVRLESSLG